MRELLRVLFICYGSLALGMAYGFYLPDFPGAWRLVSAVAALALTCLFFSFFKVVRVSASADREKT